eukprot:354175-Chlamydomonas_euryale.AAC.13
MPMLAWYPAPCPADRILLPVHPGCVFGRQHHRRPGSCRRSLLPRVGRRRVQQLTDQAGRERQGVDTPGVGMQNKLPPPPHKRAAFGKHTHALCASRAHCWQIAHGYA